MRARPSMMYFSGIPDIFLALSTTKVHEMSTEKTLGGLENRRFSGYY
jgi:hypothetical protein